MIVLSSYRLSPAAESVVDVDVVEGFAEEFDPPCYAVLRAHYARGAVRLPATRADAEAVWQALTELANAQDDQPGPFGRAAAASLGRVASVILRAAVERDNVGTPTAT